PLSLSFPPPSRPKHPTLNTKEEKTKCTRNNSSSSSSWHTHHHSTRYESDYQTCRSPSPSHGHGHRVPPRVSSHLPIPTSSRCRPTKPNQNPSSPRSARSIDPTLVLPVRLRREQQEQLLVVISLTGSKVFISVCGAAVPFKVGFVRERGRGVRVVWLVRINSNATSKLTPVHHRYPHSIPPLHHLQYKIIK
ncbi:hypothetical protein T439DRAFT_347619, partial [Meredithblackwellia eburnea MCA 4105]